MKTKRNAAETEQKAKDYVPPSGGEVYLHPTDPALSATERHRQNWYDCIRTGEEGPLDIRLANDQVLRFRCKVLPDGGRLLTYGNVSDLVRHLLGSRRSVDFARGDAADAWCWSPGAVSGGIAALDGSRILPK